MNEPLIDIGVNLLDTTFLRDLDDVIRRAQDAGVAAMIITGTTVARSTQGAAVAKVYPKLLWSTAGVHPHHAKDCVPDTISELKELAKDTRVVAIGECGLDYARDYSPRDVQRYWFAKQVELACDLQLPLFLHERDALEDEIAILQQFAQDLPRAVIHCFTGNAEALAAYRSLDLYVGITGWICDERRGYHLHDLVRNIPHNRLMLETDAPYLLPRTIVPKPKSRRNEPCNLPYVLKTVAACLDKSPEEVARATTKTAREFFAIDPSRPL